MLLSQVRRPTQWLLGLTVVGLVACDNTTTAPLPPVPPPPAAQVSVQVVTPGADGIVNTATTGPVFQARNADGSPAAGVTMRFANLNGGSLANATATTNANGEASPGAWTLGTRAGVQSVSASVVGPGVLSSVLAAAGPYVTFFAPPALQGKQFETASELSGLTFLAVDQFGNQVAQDSIPVAFAAIDGSLGPPVNVLTDELGHATAGDWTLGGTAGPQQVRADFAVGVTPTSSFLTVNATEPP